MIDAKELRKNNIVKFVKPVHINLGHINVKNNTVRLSTYGIHLIENDKKTKVNPIKLTEEWLVKGNIKLNLEFRIGRKGFIVSKAQDDDLVLLFSSDIGIDYCMLCDLDFVHNFQNVIFALTGEELTIK